MKSKLLLGVLMLATAACANAEIKGLWEFSDTDDLTAATVGNDLGLVGTHTAMTGIDSGDGAVSIGVGSHYQCWAGIPANGGGGWVNEFTLLFDIQYPASSIGTWRAFFNTNNTNSNDADYFIHPSDESWGVSSIGYTDNASIGEFYSSADTWYRAVMSVDLGGDNPFIKLYIDGVLVATHTSGLGLDGRMSLYTDPAITLILLGDENGEDNEMYCSTLAIWDTPLDADTVADLGVAGDPVEGVTKVTPREPDFVPVDTILEWAALTGMNVSAYDVWFGKDPNLLSPTPDFEKIVDKKLVTSVDPSPGDILESDTVYYWRVDTYEPNLVSGLDTFMGEGKEWSFRTAPEAPVILTQPVSMVIAGGETAEFTVGGVNLVTYTWYVSEDAANDTPADDVLKGEENSLSPLLSIPDVQLADEGYYYCVAENSGLTDVSDVASLAIERLIHYYPLDNEIADDAIGGVNGTVVGDPNWIAGIDGGAIDMFPDTMSALEDYIVLGQAGDIAYGTDDFTVSFWMKTPSIGSDPALFSNKDWDSGSNIGWVIAWGGSGDGIYQWNLDTDGAGRNDFDPTGPETADNQWHMVTVSHDRQGMATFYIDGEVRGEVGISAHAGSSLDSGFPTVIGNDGMENYHVKYPGARTRCAFDDVRIYNYALDVVEVAELYTDFVDGVWICPDGHRPVLDLVENCRIDLADFAVIAEAWLECGRVPVGSCDW